MGFNPEKSRIPVLKRLIPSIKKKLAKLTSHDGFTLKTSNGALFLLNSRNYVDRQIAFYDDFEQAQITYFLGHMSRMGCDLFLDVGSNIGFYSILVAKRKLAPRIVAFEPDIRNRLQFDANILLNHIVGEVDVRPQAVSDRGGSVSFYAAPASSTGQSRVATEGGNITVDCVTLDEAVPETGKRIAIKIDIEGHEPAAIQGMKTLVANNAVLLQVECFPANIAQVTAALADMGMRPIHQIGDDHYFSNITGL